ncbi:MAG: sugar transporter substrate-binding protein [Aeromicrobium sp.]|nr:sugar transporter substrate-binding protein [Aeromicrobium sp.]
MKKSPTVSIAMLGLTAALALSGCASSDSKSASGGHVDGAAILKQAGSATPDPKVVCAGGKHYTLGYNAFSDTETFSVQEWIGLQKLAKSLGCVKIERLIDNADATQALQNAKIFAQKQVDGVMTFNIIAAAAPGQARVFKTAKIPAITVGISAPDLPFVTVDEGAAGAQAGEAMAKAFVDSGKSGQPYLIVARNDVVGPVGVERMDGVTTGAQSVIKDLPKDHILPIQAGDPAKAQARTLDVLGKVPKGATILFTGINDDIGYGVFRGIVQAGRDADAIGVSLGAVRPGGLNYICKNKQFAGGVSYQPDKFADYMIPAIIALINGADVPAKLTVPTKYVASADITKEYPDFTCGEK